MGVSGRNNPKRDIRGSTTRPGETTEIELPGRGIRKEIHSPRDSSPVRWLDKIIVSYIIPTN